MNFIFLFVVFILAGIGAQIVGFGISAISMALLPLILPLSVAIPLVAMISVVVAGIVAWQTKTTNLFKILGPLLLGSVVGIPIGLILPSLLREEVLSVFLGILLILSGGYGLLGIKSKLKLNKTVGVLVGLIAGLFGTALNVNGPLVGMYSAQNNKLTKYESKDLITTYMFITGLFIVVGHYFAGRITSKILNYFIFALPGLWLGLYIGDKIFKKAKIKLLRQIIYLFVLLAGISLIFF
jgi:uncharacterized protein